jgi:hypothetical protein
MQEQITSEPRTALANKGQLYGSIFMVSVFHIYLAWQGDIKSEICIVGLGMQCLYLRVASEFPKVVLKWYTITLLFGNVLHALL